MTQATHHKNLLHRMGKAIGETARTNESHFTELLGSLGHLGVLFLAFGFVVVLFMWKEGKLHPSSNAPKVDEMQRFEPNMALKQVPRADVGMRMIFDQANGELGTGSGRLATPSAYPTLPEDIPTNDTGLSSTLPTIDMIGPWTCRVDRDGNSIQMYIQDKKVKFVSGSAGRTERTLLNGDCIYTWGGNTNTKQCGIGQYIEIFTSMAGADGFDVGSLLAGDMTGDTETAVYADLVRSCQKTPVAQSVFTVPEGLQWEESTEDFGGIGISNLFQ